MREKDTSTPLTDAKAKLRPAAGAISPFKRGLTSCAALTWEGWEVFLNGVQDILSQMLDVLKIASE